MYIFSLEKLNLGKILQNQTEIKNLIRGNWLNQTLEMTRATTNLIVGIFQEFYLGIQWQKCFHSYLAPYPIKQSLSISPRRRPPSLALPSVGCLVSTALGPLDLACILSITICFNF